MRSVPSQLAIALLALPLAPFAAAIEPDQPSRAAIAAAAARAVGSHDPDPFTRNPDWLAGPFLSLSELALIFSHPINRAVDQDPRISVLDGENLSLIRLAAVRTRFIDDRLQRAVGQGVAQVVILGAGFDTRAYRFRALLQKAKVFELDRPATQDVKKRRVREVFGVPPPNVTYIGVDLEHDALSSVLAKAGFRPAGKTFFIWEGGSMYLPEDAVLAILRTIVKAAPASSLVMDFAGRSAIERARQDPTSAQQRFYAAWGEPWRFGIPETPGADAFFRDLGFKPVELLPVDSPTAARRYLTHRDQTVVGQGVETDERVPITLAELAVP